MTESPFKRDISVEINVKPSPCCSEYRFKQILKSIAHFKWYCLNSFTANFYFLSIQLRIDDAVFFLKIYYWKPAKTFDVKKKKRIRVIDEVPSPSGNGVLVKQGNHAAISCQIPLFFTLISFFILSLLVEVSTFKIISEQP